ncbi:MAG TPA: DUF1800 domain-containing protein [Rhizomicrobium sp.]|nr:DUF1800 domain-containing protein [Rhizomicrobium sp.]
MSLEAAVAVHRFGLGARPGEIPSVGPDARRWLMGQLDSGAGQPQPLDGGAPFLSGGALVGEFIAYREQRQMERKQPNPPDPVKLFFQIRGEAFKRELAARFALGFTTQTPFAERLVWFWSNHFTVSATNPAAITFVPAFEREAIRPNIAGKFEDMLLASTRHPAMQLYLDNAENIGPDSLAGRITGKGLNENLGRELMELHTLGVDGGYTQADVIALARILTGWSLDKDGGTTGFRYYPARHEPGDIVLRGKTYSGGEEAGIQALKDLAHDPATARHIARKFAVHFIADDPPPESVARLEASFIKTGGDLRALAQTALDDPAAWAPGPGKMRSPVEYTTAAMRFVAWPHDGDRQKQVLSVMAASRMMGEIPMLAPSPKGWPDTSEAWSGPDALLNRIEWAKELGSRIPAGVDAVAVADATMGPLLAPPTRAAMKAAGMQGDAVALLLSSPEFQRR